jgi:hypothetical protein
MAPPDGFEVDDVAHDKLNREENLGLATDKSNKWNQTKRPTYGGKPTSSIYKGVTWVAKRNRWMAQIKRTDGTHICLGYFRPDDEISAALAYDEAATKYFGEFARTNASMGLL